MHFCVNGLAVHRCVIGKISTIIPFTVGVYNVQDTQL